MYHIPLSAHQGCHIVTLRNLWLQTSDKIPQFALQQL